MEKDKTDVGKVETQLRHWGLKLDDIIAKTGTAGGDVKKEYRKHVDGLKTSKKAAQLRLGELRTSGGEKWAIFKTGIGSAWNRLELTLKNLMNGSE